MNPGLVVSNAKTHLFSYRLTDTSHILQGPRSSLGTWYLHMLNPNLSLLKVIDSFAIEFNEFGIELLGLIFQSLSKY